jgi:hypothetical protein
MNNSARFVRVAGIFAILLTLFTLGNVITLFMSVNNNAQAFSDTRLLLSVGDRGADLFHWSMVFDIFAYLSFAPIVLLCWSWFRPANKTTLLLYTFCGLAYSLLGSTGAAVLGAVVPNLMRAYGLASAPQRENMQMVVGAFYQSISRGVWNPLEILLVGIWFLGIASALRHQKRALGILALVIGFFAMLDPLGWILNNDLVFNVGVGGMVLMPIWSMWLGIDFLRHPNSLDRTEISEDRLNSPSS